MRPIRQCLMLAAPLRARNSRLSVANPFDDWFHTGQISWLAAFLPQTCSQALMTWRGWPGRLSIKWQV